MNLIVMEYVVWRPGNNIGKAMRGKKLTDFTHKIGNLIENDIEDIVGFMKKHLY
ncbi:hypothetical protein PMX40_07255 [Clostridium paraputrificum]|nr:hypothetical protein [Clostridium paraputrificum]